MRPASVIVVNDVFLDPRRARLVLDGETLADLAPVEPGAWLCLVDGEAIPRDLWGCMPHRGSVVVFRQLPQGGKGGSNPLRMALMIGLMILAPQLAPFLKLQGILTGVSSAAITAVATMAGTALINNLVPIDATNSASTGGAQQFAAQAQGNVARIGQPIPEIFGYDHGWPDLGAQPYNLYEDNEQYLHLLLVVGRGQYDITRVSIGDAPITSFSEAEIVRIGPGQSTQEGPGTGVESIDDVTLIDPSWVTSEDVSNVEMKTLDYVGPFTACRPERRVNKIGVDIVLPRGLDDSRSVAWKVETRTVDDFGAATGPWSVLSTHTYNTKSVIPLRLSYNYDVALERYQVRVVRTDSRSNDDGSAHDISWLALRGHLGGTFSLFGPESVTGKPNLPDCTMIAVKVRASGQLSGSLRFRVQSKRMLPIWNGSTWSAPTVTRSPAWALARVLKSRDTPDAAIDLDQLLALAAVWDARQDRFDFRFDSQISVWDALTQIARVGRAFPMIRGSRYTFVRDELQTAPVALYGMRNIRRGSMRMDVRLPEADSMYALDVEYWDHRRWDWVVVTAQIDNGQVYAYRGAAQRADLGLSAPDPLRTGRIKIPGVVGENHAKRFAAYTLADGYFRRVSVEYDTELDGMLPPPLALVVFQHDVGNFGQGGDIALWDEATRLIGATEAPVWTPGAQHYIRLMKPQGTLTSAMRVDQAGVSHAATLSAAGIPFGNAMVVDAADFAAEPAFEVVFDDAGRERTRYLFGPAESMGALAKVRGISPRNERTVTHRLLLEDDRVHAADNPWLPAGAEQDPLGDSLLPDVSGGDRIVSLTDRSFYINNIGSVTLDFRFDVHNDGRMSWGYAGGPTISAYWPYEWLNPQTVTSAVAGLYEVMVSSAEATGGDSLDTWLPLDTSRHWEAVNGVPGPSHSASFYVRIRDVATGTVQDTCTISYTINDNSP